MCGDTRDVGMLCRHVWGITKGKKTSTNNSSRGTTGSVVLSRVSEKGS